MTSDAPRLTKDEVAHVAHLARLNLTDDELDLFTAQLGDVLAHAEDIERLDVEGLAPTAHPVDMFNVMRPDVVRPSLDRAEVLAGAPAHEEGQFKVPAILGEEP